MDSNGLSDPYVKVKIPVDEMGAGLISVSKKERKRQQKQKQKQKDKQEYVEYASKIHYKNLNPEFNERFEFSPASEEAKVTIEIFDVDSTFPVGKKSNFMGNLVIPISTIVEHGGTMEARFKVGNAKSGEIDLAFNWQPYT
jgi:Ca2+-dependent lipid-binding protein